MKRPALLTLALANFCRKNVPRALAHRDARRRQLRFIPLRRLVPRNVNAKTDSNARDEARVLTFQGPYVTLPKFRLPCDRLVAPDHVEITSESRVHFSTLLNC